MEVEAMNASVARPLVCVVDDDSLVRESVEGLLREEGFQVRTFESAESFLDRPGQEPPACMIVDLSLPGMSGLDLHQELARTGMDAPTMLLTAHGDVPTSVRAMKAGVLDFLTKPYDDDDLLAAVRRAVCGFRAGLAAVAIRVGGIVGESEALQAVLKQVELVADTDATVLITGESGTGKDLVARAIHERSRRRDAPLVRVNCGSIPESLFESELFGYVRGAFTGALTDRTGRFGAAEGGTLMLDEIGEVPLTMQPKLLHVLQEKAFERVGETRTRKIDVRIVAATNRDLAAEVEAGRFRGDLFYRLNVFPIENPPLRDRREDIPLLAKHFIQASARRLHREPPRLTETAPRQLMTHDWPGNIRELENVIERAVILAGDGQLRFDPGHAAAVPQPHTASNPLPLLSRTAVEKQQRDTIVAALERSGGRVSGPRGAAELLGMKASTLFSRMSVLGLRHRAT
jgi:DNA-binding NtrC family response regulator